MPGPQSLPRERRLLRPTSFRRVYDGGGRRVGRHLVVFLLPGEGPGRVGVVASRKVGNAVARARAKRRLRELYRRHQHLLHPGIDVVLVARKGLPDVSWPRLVKDYLRTGRAAGLLTPDSKDE